MLILPPFELLRPTTVAEAVEALTGSAGEVKVIAGGTDLLPNLKHGLYEVKRLVSTRRLADLKEISIDDAGWLRVGAGVTLHRVASDAEIGGAYPALSEAAAAVAGPQHRRMGTLGGNLCLDTRCVYINQSHFWRQALGFCFKKDGTRCHVVPSGKRCVAAFSADTPGPLIALGAEVELVSSRGLRRLPVAEFFTKDGVHNTVKTADELVTAILLPPRSGATDSAYTKLRARKSIDFPTLSVAASVRWADDHTVDALEIVVGGLGPKPRRISKIMANGRKLDRVLIDEVSALAARQCTPLRNIAASPDWRGEVVPVHVAKTLAQLHR